MALSATEVKTGCTVHPNNRQEHQDPAHAFPERWQLSTAVLSMQIKSGLTSSVVLAELNSACLTRR